MSFILDALKKSESERQRQAGPALFEVKVTPPRHRVAPWAAALAALLAINLGVVGWMLARDRSARRGAAAHEPAGAATPTAAPAALQPDKAPGVTPTASTAQSGGAPQAASSGQQAPNPGGPGDSDSNPADYAPAVEPPRSPPAPSDAGSVVQETESSLPTYQQAAAVPGANIPPLRLDLHAYSEQPDQSFVFLNMVKLREGDSLPQGVRVDKITPDGVILSYQGQRFVLHRQ